MKKLLAILIMVIAISVALPAMASENIKVTVGGERVIFDVQPQLINDRTMVPLRAIFEALDATVSWDDATQVIKAMKGNTLIRLEIDDNTMWVNSKKVTLDVPATLVNGRTLVPVRAISEAFDLKVDWIEATNTVKVRTPVSLAIESCTGPVIEYHEYDENGNEILYKTSNEYWLKTEYDENGNAVKSVDSDEVEKTYTVDQDGNVIYWEDTEGNWLKSAYDANGLLTYIEHSDGWCDKAEYDSKGNLIYYEVTEENWWQKSTYDENSNLISTETSDGYKATFTYDENGNQTYWKDSTGYWVKTNYDEKGLKVSTENSEGGWEKFTYDESGNEIYYEDNTGNWTRYSYDYDNNLTYWTSASGAYEKLIVMNI